MSYIKSKLNDENQMFIRDYLLSEGFSPNNGSFSDILNYFVQGSTNNVTITANLDAKTLEYYAEYRYGGGKVHKEIINYTDNLVIFQDEYKSFVDKAIKWTC